MSGTPLFKKTNVNNKSLPIFSSLLCKSQKWIFQYKKFKKPEKSNAWEKQVFSKLNLQEEQA